MIQICLLHLENTYMIAKNYLKNIFMLFKVYKIDKINHYFISKTIMIKTHVLKKEMA